MATDTITQPASGLGSSAETNRLLGGSYFNPSGSQLQTFTPTVLTSKAAQNDLNQIKTSVGDVTAGIADQAAKVAAQQAAAREADRQTKATSTEQALANAKLQIEQQTADAKTAAVNGSATAADSSGGHWEDRGDGAFEWKTGNSASGAQAEYDTKTKEYETEAKNVRDTILNIQNGTIPFTPGEQAQIDSLTQQFETLISQQKLSNISEQGMTNMRGYQKGSAEYDPTFQVKTVGSIVTGGLNKVADLNAKMAGSVADLTNALREKKISAVKSAWDVYSTAAKERTSALKELVTSTSKAVETARKAHTSAVRDSAISSLISEGITDPKQVLDTLNAHGGTYSAKEVTDALKALSPGDDLSKLSGTTKNFFILKGLNQLPASITSLPEDQQMFAYLKMQHQATVSAKSPSTKTITLSDAVKYSLPVSVVGSSEAELVKDLDKDVAPSWFIEKAKGEYGSDTSDEDIKTAWDDFRLNFGQ